MEVSPWAGHSSVLFMQNRHGHLYDDGADDVADRIDTLLKETAPDLRSRRAGAGLSW